MRKPTTFLWIAAVVILGGTSAFLFSRYHSTASELANVRVTEEASRARYAQTIDAIAEIQDSLNAIAIGDANVKLVSSGLQSEKDLQSPDGRDALQRIATMRSSIQRNKDRIRQLESSLSHSGIQVNGLKRMVVGLNSSVAEKERQIGELSSRIEVLATQVTGLATTVQEGRQQIAQKNETLEDRRRELATVYYVVGSKRELTTQGVVVARGGVLGMGKTLQPSGRVAQAVLIPLDTDRETVVTIEAPKAQVVSAQPLASYELRLVGGKMELHILDANEFRKVKQLVIVTA